MSKVICGRCNREKEELYFYRSRAGEVGTECKDCMTLFIDNFDESTYVPILEKLDFPYVPEEWNNIRSKAMLKNPKLTGKSVLGKYLSKMRIVQYKDYSWKDSEELQKKSEERRAKYLEEHPEEAQRIADAQVLLDRGEIDYAEFNKMVGTNSAAVAPPASPPGVKLPNAAMPSVNPYAAVPSPSSEDAEYNLTEEDRRYLSMKWGNLYKVSEWVRLEKYYQRMKSSFDIQDADTEGTLVLIAKTYIKMNAAIDMGDMDGYNKLSRAYESLRKSSKFTAAQNKDEKNDFVDCIGQMVAYCEKEGGKIPKHKIDTPIDIIDEIIIDLKEYNKSLIYADTSLAQQIEQYLKNRENAEQQKKDREEAKKSGKDFVEVTDEDVAEHIQSIRDQQEQDWSDEE